MLTKTLIGLVTAVLLSSETSASTGWLIYYEKAFKGKVINSETKEPIEGAVVVAIYHTNLCGPLFVPKCGSNTVNVQEVLTDKEGNFYIPRKLFFHPWPFTLGGEDTGFIIFKPGYGSISTVRFSYLFFPYGKFTIYSIKPSTIQYLEFHKNIIQGQEIEYGIKKTKNYPEGLIYIGKECYVFIPMRKAMEKITKLEVPLDCPSNGEAVPHIDHNFRNDIERHMNNSFVIVELTRVNTLVERINSHKSVYITGDISDSKIPNLKRLLKEDDDYIRSIYKYDREAPEIPIIKIPKR